MDPLMQRLQVAQDLCQSLLMMLDMPQRPPRAQVQVTIDAANAKLQAIAALEGKPEPPFQTPQIVPKVMP